jgi:hypothetical protein
MTRTIGDHALVLGGSVAGLLACGARKVVLATLPASIR